MRPLRRAPPLLALAAVSLALVPARQPPEAVAVVIRVAGAVHVLRGQPARATPAAAGTRLVAGDVVRPAAGAAATLLHRDGRIQAVAAPLRLAAPGTAPPQGLFARTVGTLQQVAVADPRQQPGRAGVIRPVPGGIVAIEPRNGIRVLDVRPRLVWSAVPGAASYTIQLWSAGEAPVRFRTGTDTTTLFPDSLPPLRPGVEYRWTVAAAPRGRPAQPQTFRVAGEPERAAIAHALDALRAAGLDPDGDGLLLAAIAYRDAGLVYRARAALDRLEATGGPLGPEALLLRARLLEAAGDSAAADGARARARGRNG